MRLAHFQEGIGFLAVCGYEFSGSSAYAGVFVLAFFRFPNWLRIFFPGGFRAFRLVKCMVFPDLRFVLQNLA